MHDLKARLKRTRDKLQTKYFADVIFVHVNKTGGSSIEKALGLPFRHRTALELLEEIGPRRWGERFSFAFVRNPWDRVVSQYHYRGRTDQTDMATHPIEFNEWVRLAYAEQDSRYYDNPRMFMPQASWVSNYAGEIMVDFIGRYEFLQEDFRRICEILRRQAQLPHLKRSARKSYREMYTDRSIEIVDQWFAPDIARFGYSFDGFSKDAEDRLIFERPHQ